VKEIWKFTRDIQDPFDNQRMHVEMPKGARALSVGAQDFKLCIWAIVDPDFAEVETHTFVVVMTGVPVKLHANMSFLGTVQFHTAPMFVLHVFDEGVR